MSHPRLLEAKLSRVLRHMLSQIVLSAKRIEPYSKKEIAATRADDELSLYGMESSFDWLEHQASIYAAHAIIQSIRIGAEVSAWNQKRQFRLIRSSILTAVSREAISGSYERLSLRPMMEIDLFGNEPWLLDQLASYNRQISSLIKSLSQEQVSKISGAVLRAMQSGDAWKDVSKEIQKGIGICERRANLIARDQVSKLNGALTRHRQMQAGIKNYVWRTSLDERVRPSHKANEGKVFSWRKAPDNTGHNHPGGDYQCRCTAEPVVLLK